MRPPRIRSKKALELSGLDKRLNSYSLAAAAAGVGMLALAQPAAARIIYTKAHRNIGPNSMVKLDLNHDGIVDFNFKDIKTTSSFGGGLGLLSVDQARQSNRIWGHMAFGRTYASALPVGVRIGPKGQFVGRGLMAAVSSNEGLRRENVGTCSGPWDNVTNRYLGVKFQIKGKTHFGWARLNVSCDLERLTVTGTMTGYAYETVPNRVIVTGKETGTDEFDDVRRSSSEPVPAPEPAILGRLAQGADGVATWRRR